MPILNSGNVQGQIIRSRCEAGILCHEVIYSGGTRLDKHGHEGAFLALSLDGSYHESTWGAEFDCVPRSVVFHPPGEEHAIFMAGANVRCFVVELDVEQIRRRYDAVVPASLRHDDGGPLSALMTTLYGEFRLADRSSTLAMQGLLLQILAGASRAESADEEHGRPSWLDRIGDILRDRFRSRLTLDDISTEVGVSPARLSAAFRRFHRRSIAGEQRRLRVEFACDRLRDPAPALADIAMEAGFSDQPHFSRAFKQLMGMTPAQYRALFT